MIPIRLSITNRRFQVPVLNGSERFNSTPRRLTPPSAFSFNLNRLFAKDRNYKKMTITHVERFDVDREVEGRVAIVTGANKGIGFETARGLAALGFEVVLTARDEGSGLEAVNKIRDEFPQAKVEWMPLELTDAKSRESFLHGVRDRYGSVSVLVNNAGFAFKGSIFGAAELQQTLAVNYYGTRDLTEALLPLLSSNARIVFVSSRAGSLRIIPSAEIRTKVQNAQSASALDQLCLEYGQAIREGSWKQRGWPGSMYGFSKACISRYTQILASQLASDPRQIVVTACCPGYVATAMSSFGGEKTPEEGADTSIFCAVAPRDHLKSGKMYAERNEISYT